MDVHVDIALELNDLTMTLQLFPKKPLFFKGYAWHKSFVFAITRIKNFDTLNHRLSVVHISPWCFSGFGIFDVCHENNLAWNI